MANWDWRWASIPWSQLRTDTDVNRKGATEFTKVGNELFNLLEDGRFDIYEKAVIMALVGQIYRYHRTHVTARRQEIADGAGISVRKVSDVLQSLKEKKIVNVVPISHGTYIVAFNHLPEGSGGPTEEFNKQFFM